MRDAAQAGLDAADDDWHVLEGFTTALGVDIHRAIWPFAAFPARGVGIVTANFTIRGIAIDHGIHIASAHAEKQIGPTQAREVLRIPPIRLGNDPHTKTLCLQHPTDHRHAKTGMIDIGITGHQDDVATVPMQIRHFLPAHGQKRCRAKLLGPVFTVRKNVRG